jgi:uncharacterized iron-regulated protein
MALTRRDFLLSGVLALAGCAGPRLLYENHPLVGRIWDARDQRFINPHELLARVAAADIVLLGEVHDNEIHHRIQDHVARAMAARGPARRLVLEQLDAEHQSAVDAARGAGATAGQLLEAGRMAKGWERAFYEPLVATALRAGWRVVAGNLSREAAQPVIRGGFDKLLPEQLSRLAVPAVWSDAREETLRKLIFEGHCKAIPPALVEGLARSQRLRDATLADALLQGPPPAALGIMGNGHARRDLGVPLYVNARNPSLALASLGMVEVTPEKTAPADYANPLGEGMFDFIWFTPQLARKDPCVGFSMR